MPLSPVLRRISLPGIAALALGLCLCSPAVAGAHGRARLQSGVSEGAATGTLEESASGSPAGSSSTPEREREERRASRRQERQERRAARRQERRGTHTQSSTGAGCKITLQAPRIATAGAPLVLYGTLSCAEAAQEPEQTVTAYQKLAGTPGYALAASATTESEGAFHVSVSALEGNSAFYAVAGTATSPRIRVGAAPAVTIAAPAAGTPLFASGDRATSAAAAAADAVTFTGTVSPADASATVALQREFKGGGWQRIASGRVEEDGDYSILHSFSRPGRLTLRVLVRSHGRFLTSASTPVAYTIYRDGATPASGQAFTVTATPAPASAPAGEPLTFTGAVAPAHEGQAVDLERANLSGLHGYHVIATGTVSSSSTYSIAYAFPAVGNALLRISVAGEGEVQAGASDPFKLEITPASGG